MGAARIFLPVIGGTLLLLGSTASIVAQDGASGPGNWLTQPAPGVGGSSGSGSSQPVPGKPGWSVKQEGGVSIYSKDPPGSGSSGSGSDAPTTGMGGDSGSLMDGKPHPVPGKPGWTMQWDPRTGQATYTPPQQSTQPPPPTQPSQQATHEVDAGWVQDKKGKTKLVYIKDSKGDIVGGYYAHYDSQGNLVGKEPFNGSGAPSTSNLPVQGALQGTYSGSFSGGGASGSITLHVSGAIVGGSISGQKSGDPVHAQFSGSIDGSGGFQANITGTVEWGKGVPFGGTMSGQFTQSSASGSWYGAGGLDKASGTWHAAHSP